MNNDWIVGTLQSAFNTWNDKLAEIWSLITTTPQNFRGGSVWTAIVGVNDALKAVGYGLLALFFAMSIFQSAVSFRDFQRPEFVLRHFIRFLLAKVAVGSAMEIMTAIFSVCGGVVETVMSSVGGMAAAGVTVPQEIADAVNGVGFLQSIPLWLVSFLGSLFITVMSFILILTVYGRFFRLYLFTALAPLPLASFAGESTSFAGKAFLKSYIGVCMEGAVIVLACLIFSAFMSGSAPVVDTSLSAVTMAWQYIGETIFNMLVLVGLVKGAERIAGEMCGLAAWKRGGQKPRRFLSVPVRCDRDPVFQAYPLNGAALRVGEDDLIPHLALQPPVFQQRPEPGSQHNQHQHRQHPVGDQRVGGGPLGIDLRAQSPPGQRRQEPQPDQEAEHRPEQQAQKGQDQDENTQLNKDRHVQNLPFFDTSIISYPEKRVKKLGFHAKIKQKLCARITY